MRTGHMCGKQGAALLAAFSLVSLMAGCANIKLWPFGSSQPQERSREPANATAYQCAAGKRFYLRYLDNGAAAWVILPDREVRLDKAVPSGNADGTRYSNGIAVLDVQSNSATLTDGPAITYSGCTTTGS